MHSQEVYVCTLSIRKTMGIPSEVEVEIEDPSEMVTDNIGGIGLNNIGNVEVEEPSEMDTDHIDGVGLNNAGNVGVDGDSSESEPDLDPKQVQPPKVDPKQVQPPKVDPQQMQSQEVLLHLMIHPWHHKELNLLTTMKLELLKNQ